MNETQKHLEKLKNLTIPTSFSSSLFIFSRGPPEPVHLASQPVNHQEGDPEPHAKSGPVQTPELLAPQLLHPRQDSHGQGGIVPGSDAGIWDSPVQYLLYPWRRAPSEYEHQEGPPTPEALLKQEDQEEDVALDRPWLVVPGNGYQSRYQHSAPPGAGFSRQGGYTKAFPKRGLFKRQNH